MPDEPKDKKILSKLTKCTNCLAVVEFETSNLEDPDGAWQCPRCGYRYEFKNRTIPKR